MNHLNKIRTDLYDIAVQLTKVDNYLMDKNYKNTHLEIYKIKKKFYETLIEYDMYMINNKRDNKIDHLLKLYL
jgi:hypothetical protein